MQNDTTSTMDLWHYDKPRPLHRLLARMFDTCLLSLIVPLLLARSLHLDFSPVLLVPALAVVVQHLVWKPLMLARYGTTFGKSLFNIKVVNANGDNLTYGEAVKRSMRVLFFGLGLYLGIIWLIAGILSENALRKRGITYWDRLGNCKVMHARISLVRFLVAVVLSMLTMSVGGMLLSPH